jgi:hypothetical protein
MSPHFAKISAWVKAHKKETAIGGAGVVVVGALVLKSRSKSSAASTAAAAAAASTSAAAATTNASAGATCAADSANGGGYGGGGATMQQMNSMEGQLNTLTNDATDATAAASAATNPATVPASTSADGTNIVNLPTTVKHAALVDAVAAPAGGVWYLGSDGGVFAEGGAKSFGAFPGLPAADRTGAARKFISLIPTATGGYAEVDSAGEVYNFGPTAAKS